MTNLVIGCANLEPKSDERVSEITQSIVLFL